MFGAHLFAPFSEEVYASFTFPSPTGMRVDRVAGAGMLMISGMFSNSSKWVIQTRVAQAYSTVWL